MGCEDFPRSFTRRKNFPVKFPFRQRAFTGGLLEELSQSILRASICNFYTHLREALARTHCLRSLCRRTLESLARLFSFIPSAGVQQLPRSYVVIFRINFFVEFMPPLFEWLLLFFFLNAGFTSSSPHGPLAIFNSFTRCFFTYLSVKFLF